MVGRIKAPWGFPGSPLVKNLPANAGDPGSIPGPGRSHTCFGATRPACCNYRNLCALELVLCNKRSHCNEKSLLHNQRKAAHGKEDPA